MAPSPVRPFVLAAAAAGALGGALNAAHALWLLPRDLQWHVVPAGMAHGGLLAAGAAWAAGLARERSLGQRLLGVPLSGWITGLVAWAPLCASLEFGFLPDPPWLVVWSPFFQMGLATSIAYAGWAVLGGLRSVRLAVHVAIGVAAGVLGSAWWWIEWEKGDAWRYFPLHGVTWGVLVGLAAWRAARRAEHAA
jgi:hypothetical protein